MKDDAILIERIIRYCDKIEKSMDYFSKDGIELKYNEYFQDTSSFYITQIGESVKSLSSELRDEYPEIRWRGIIGMRNIISHGYDGMNADTLWSIVTEDVPVLKIACQKILEEF